MTTIRILILIFFMRLHLFLQLRHLCFFIFCIVHDPPDQFVHIFRVPHHPQIFILSIQYSDSLHIYYFSLLYHTPSYGNNSFCPMKIRFPSDSPFILQIASTWPVSPYVFLLMLANVSPFFTV